MARSRNRLRNFVRRIGGLTLISPVLLATVAAQEVLPRPDPKFNGMIGQTYKDSTPDKIPLVKAPAGAPNVLLILIDDCGFGQWGTFGGQVPTPNLDRLAQEGLRYTRFHTTALCSPTRAALLTGRNHHSAGTGVITELGSGYPGYSGQIPKSDAMVAEILRQNGYSTAFFGKNHNIPDWETSISGPFDRWPGLQGFDHFYGFIGGEANQWQPALYSDNRAGRDGSPQGPRGRLHAQRGAGGQGHRVHPSGEVGHARPAVLRLLRAGRDARAAPCPQGVDRQVQGPVRPGLGQVPRGDVSAPAQAGRHSGGHEADAAAGRNSRPGTR